MNCGGVKQVRKAGYASVVIVCLLWMMGCGPDDHEVSLSPKSISTPERIEVKFGDGNKRLLDNKQEVEHIMDQIRNFDYVAVEIPDSVGQHFTLIIGPDMQYTSTGYLRMNGSLFKVDEDDGNDVIGLDRYVMNILALPTTFAGDDITQAFTMGISFEFAG